MAFVYALSFKKKRLGDIGISALPMLVVHWSYNICRYEALGRQAILSLMPVSIFSLKAFIFISCRQDHLREETSDWRV
jgi:hypothetical protein